ncbi:pseudouridine synthase [Bradyrhizobium sp. BWA-3-5]|uniref:pseudouridine synthase n=1 Tax=Bradyrhizobium sp. BWA-3-5 TaxID=3080013 RepID=UPI00293EA088|nr:pseudouridine synthase [Bradyrhizobium sp. BWA-3-5]WOH67347.1 pseudouridine synthase [Bradyrhizobium sp. BWA-3-5]
MPRDNDKNNDSRGRRDRPGGGKGRAGGGKGRSGAARGPEKKFAKRGFGARDDGERRPYAGKSEGAKSFGKKPYAGRRDGDDRPPRRDFGDRPQRFNRDDGPDRGPRKDFRPREDRDGEKRSFKPRGDRPNFDRDRDDRPPRRNRDDARPAGRFSEKKFGDKRPYAPRGDRPYGDRPPRDGEKRFSRGPRKDFGDRPERGEEKPWQKRDDRGGRDRGSFDRPRFDRSRDDRGGDDRPRFSRSREDRPKFDRPRERRDRDGDRGRPAGRTEWQEHPRSEGRFNNRPRRDNEDDSRIFAKRPAFGGRGAYRERTPDFDKRAPRPESKPKKAGERIAKVVARAGLASRRDAEELITAGRVTVNGRVINSPALDVTANDVIAVDGKVLPPRERTRLFMYHKPRGLMTTHDDPEGRPTVFDNLPEGLPRLISIGRLDFNTEGLLLLTNDGGLARALELPDTGWLRRYRVRAHGEVTQAQLDELKKGVEVDGVKYGPIDAQLERDQGANVWVVFAIREGKNREVRNVMAHLGLEVNRLIRVSYGPFQLGELAEGQVEEVKTRVLREQLGEKIAALAGADFNRPAQDDKSEGDDDAPRSKKPFKPAGKSALIADRKGRRVLVQRTGSEEARARNEDEANGYGPPRRPKRGYHGKRDLKPRDE